MLTHSRPDQIFSRLLAAAAGLLLALVLATLATPASAHSVLLGTDPEDEEQLAAAPDAVSLTFNEDITELGTEVVVTTDDGQTVSEGDIQVDGPVITQALADVRPAGAYTVTWRAVSADGHPISGEYTFTAAQAAGEETESAGEETESESAQQQEETESGAQGEGETEEPEPAQTQDDPADADEGLSPSTWVIIGVLIVAAIILVTVLARSMGASKRKE